MIRKGREKKSDLRTWRESRKNQSNLCDIGLMLKIPSTEWQAVNGNVMDWWPTITFKQIYSAWHYFHDF
jgi:hypothetical protein